MARENVMVEELRAYRNDLLSSCDMLEKAIDALVKEKLHSVLGHKLMVSRDHIPAVVDFSSDILAKALQTAAASRTGSVPRVAQNKERAQRQADAAAAKASVKKKAAK